MAVYQVGIAFYETNKFRNGHVRKRKLAVFKCECTATFIARCDSIPPSCGCQTKEHQSTAAKNRGVNFSTHEMSKTKVYKVWAAMLRRCRNSNDTAYARYGGRGIHVCDEWSSFEAFYCDMGEPNGLTIERVNVDGNYCKENCVWATRGEQMRNTRRSRKITINGVTRNMIDWCNQAGAAARSTIRKRLKSGMPAEQAVFGKTK